MKMKAKKLAPSRKPTALAPASVFSRKIRRGISGASTSVSTDEERHEQDADAASSEIVRAVAQPTSGAREIA